MATLKYKTPDGEWKKVSIGGGGSTEEVYVGSDTPTDDNVKVWIDPTGTPSSPSQPSQPGGESSRGRAYFLPIGCAAETYTFSTTEAQKFKDALSQADTTYHFGFFENGLGVYCPLQMERFSEKRVYLRGSQVVANADTLGMAVWVFIVVFDEESVVCTFKQFSKNIE